MSEPSDQPGAPRSTSMAFLHASPAISLMALELWATILTFAWAASAFLGGPIWVAVAVGAICVVPGLWVTWHIVRLAIEAERYPDH
jgi:cation transporter-like permease